MVAFNKYTDFAKLLDINIDTYKDYNRLGVDKTVELTNSDNTKVIVMRIL